MGSTVAWLDLNPKQAITVWTKFPAPPAGVDTITVVNAKTPPFEDVVLT